MAALPALIPMIARGTELAAKMGIVSETLDTVQQGVETVTEITDQATTIKDQVTDVTDKVNQVDSAGSGLSELLGANDLSPFPNIQQALDTPGGMANMEIAFSEVNRNTPFEQRQAAEATQPYIKPDIQTHNVGPVAHDEE